MLSQANQIYYQAHTLWVKDTTYQKAESLRAASLSKLDKILSSIQSMLNSLQNVRRSFILAHTTNATISTKTQVLYFNQFLHPYSTSTFSQNRP